jgi:hypothetical protein
MEERNLYAPPRVNVTEVREGNCSRDGKFVIVQTGSDLPPRCIVCNEPVTAPIKKKKVYWHSTWIYILVLVNILLYLIVGIVARKTFAVSPGLCEAHAADRRKRSLILVAAGIGALAIGAALLSYEQALGAICSFLLGFAALVCAAVVKRTVYPKKITPEYAQLGGCKEPFLASLE